MTKYLSLKTYYLSLTTFSLSTFALPSICSTFLATLNIIPIAKHVKIKLVPPMLTNGKVTPVTGNKLTVTAIFATACMANVKLRPNAKNAPNAKGHRL